MTFNSKHRTVKLKTKDTKSQKSKTHRDKNLVPSKKQVQNTDLYKPVLKKTMNSRNYYIKYNFVTPLMLSMSL